MSEYVLKIKCKDEKGLIYKISKLVFESNLNITSNNEFVDQEFFFYLATLSGEIDKEGLKKELEGCLRDAEISLEKKRPKEIAILATRESHCLGSLLIAHEAGELNANIKLVMANREDLKSLVERFNIPFIFVNESSKEDREKTILKHLSSYSLEYIVLAKYMQILSPNFVDMYKGKIINIHHSFLPAFIGAKPYLQAFERGVKIIGATAHFVTSELDAGPIIYQDIIAVNHAQDALSLQRSGRSVETVALLRACDKVFDDRVFINGNKTIVF